MGNPNTLNQRLETTEKNVKKAEGIQFTGIPRGIIENLKLKMDEFLDDLPRNGVPHSNDASDLIAETGSFYGS